jgi:hypothetical protein
MFAMQIEYLRQRAMGCVDRDALRITQRKFARLLRRKHQREAIEDGYLDLGESGA